VAFICNNIFDVRPTAHYLTLGPPVVWAAQSLCFYVSVRLCACACVPGGSILWPACRRLLVVSYFWRSYFYLGIWLQCFCFEVQLDHHAHFCFFINYFVSGKKVVLSWLWAFAAFWSWALHIKGLKIYLKFLKVFLKFHHHNLVFIMYIWLCRLVWFRCAVIRCRKWGYRDV